MATFPAKTNYAAGDILTAAQMVDIGNAINDLLPDAKGSLTTVSNATTAANLAVGSDGSTLIADSAATTGLRWQGSQAAGKNYVINGGMDIWQRGTSIAGTTTSFSADRWQSYRGVAGSTFSRQTGPEGFQYCTRVQRDSGNSSTTTLFLAQNFETPTSVPLAGKTVTLSFYARAGANYSHAASGLGVTLYTGTGTDQNGLTGAYTGSITAISQTATLTTSWQRFSYNAALNTNTNEVNITFSFTPVGTASTNDWYEITGVQLEIGSVATTFTRAGGTLAGELAACQRYYYLHASGNSVPICLTANYSTTLSIGYIEFPVTMRTSPTIDVVSGTNYYGIDVNGTALAFSAPSIGAASTTSVRLDSTVSGATAGQAGYLRTANASAYLGFKAEL